MAWLLRNGQVLATAEMATSPGTRWKGLLGRDGIEGAIVLGPARSIHTIGMRFPIDVAFCDRDLVVLDTARLPPFRMCLPRRRCHFVVEAQAGAFERWKLQPGDKLEVEG